MFKKLFSFLIILSMTLVLFTGVPISVSAEEHTGDGWTFDDVTGKLTVTTDDSMEGRDWLNSCSNDMIKSVEIQDGVTLIGKAFNSCQNLETIDIPSSITETKIVSNAFNSCQSLKSITIPNSVTSIESYAFYLCKSLTSVTIPNSVTSIGGDAFNGCSSLTSVTIPDSVNTIGDKAFRGCTSLTSVTIPDSVNTIGDYAFQNCTGLTSVTIPDSVTSIGNSAFSGCTSLNQIMYKKGLTVSGAGVPATTTKIEYEENDDGTLKITNIELGSGKTAADIPAKINGMDVVAVAEDYQEFVDKTKHTAHTYVNGECTICGGKENQNTGNNISHTVENGTLTISGSGAMDDYNTTDNLPPWDSGKDSITDIVIDDGVTSIGENAFNGLTGLETVTIPDSVAEIGENAFANTTPDIVYYESGAGVGDGDFPPSATKIEYSVNGDGIVIESITLGSGVSEGDKVDIPNSIGGKVVVEVAEEVRNKVSVEGHTAHSYENGSCTICGAADPNAGSGSQGTTPTTPSNPSYPSAPSRPSTPVVTPNVTSATETTAKADEEIIADDNYTGEDISSGAGDNSDDGGITDMSMVVLVIAIAAVIAAAVLVKKLIF